jgi:drug/metabolite transporter (DMT)-like permease
VSKTIKSHLALLLVALIYGANYSIAKMVMFKYLNPFGFIVLRVVGAGILFFIIHALFVKEKIENKDLKRLFICSVFGIAGNMLMFFKGLSLTTPINASVLMLNAPVFVLIFSSIIYKIKPRLIQIVGTLIAFAGAFWLIAGKSFQLNSATALGDMFITLNAISYAFYLVYVKDLLLKYKSLTVITYSFVFGAILVIPFGWNDLQNAQFLTFTPNVWWAIAFVVLGTTFIAYLLNAWALQKTSSAIVGSYIYLQPIIASIIGVYLGQDELTAQKVWAALLVFIGVYLVSKRTDSQLKPN